MIRTAIATVAILLGLAFTGTAVAGDRHDEHGSYSTDHHHHPPANSGVSIPCAGSKLVIEETDPSTGSPVRVRLGDISAERSGNTVTVRNNGAEVLTLDLSPDVQAPVSTFAVIDAVKTLTEVCAMGRKDSELFARLAGQTLLSRLATAGLLTTSGDGYGAGFVLIIVLFILLVIVGAGFG